MKHVVALSGGKDSTALALRLAEVKPQDYEYLFTPTDNESPEMLAHWLKLEALLGKKLIRVSAEKNLLELIDFFGALPNHRQRWCTRMLKILPAIAWIEQNGPATFYVGLRADEELREGIYGDKVQSVFPLREWGWKLADVRAYLKERQIEIPERTDCLFCYAQRLGEWRNLWRKYPERYAQAVALEDKIGHTFRSPSRDTWPASLSDLAKEFEAGRKIRGDGSEIATCRVCSL